MLKTVTLLCGLGAAFVLTLSSRVCCSPEITAGPAQSSLKVQSVVFEPIGSGNGVVHVSVSNPTTAQRIFVVHVQTRIRAGWGKQYSATVKAGETKDVRCAFCFMGSIAKDASIRLRLYEPVSVETYDSEQYYQQQLFGLADLQMRSAASLKVLSKSDTRAGQVRQAFKSFQELIRQGHYGKVWDSVFSADYQAVCAESLDDFEQDMRGVIPNCAWLWDRDTMLGMRPASVSSSGNLVVLSVTDGKETWQVDFAPSASGWHIDWIGGYEPAILHLAEGGDWEKPLLAKTQVINTQHFEIHYFKNSTAKREIGSISQTRERGYVGVAKVLGLSSDRKIRLFLFEDMKTKFLSTGHQGMGWATGDTEVEVYNKKDRLDPYHETTHILMRPCGDPPAILSEGIAVYMSERLGAPALRELGGGDQTIYASVRSLKQKGEWIDLKELLTYTDIGSEKSRPTISYAEAGAFVKFLVEKLGKNAFLDAYKKLTNSDDPEIHRRNQQELERIYGAPFQRMEEDWERAFLSGR